MIEEYNILTLDNNKDYAITKIIDYDNFEYLLLVRVDEEENVLDEKIIAKKIIDNDNQVSIEVVTDKNLYDVLINLFIEEFSNN